MTEHEEMAQFREARNMPPEVPDEALRDTMAFHWWALEKAMRRFGRLVGEELLRLVPRRGGRP